VSGPVHARAKVPLVKRDHEMKSGEWQKEGSLKLAAKIA
jgi:hypothetical protein